jgi:hypothetical protein
MDQITYRKLRKYKYQITESYVVDIPIKPENEIITDFIELTTEGNLTIKEKYAWDGPSGPTIDTKNFMRGSLVHDALYQLIRNGKLYMGDREAADRLLKQHCREDGMSAARAWYVFKAVSWFGKSSCLPSDEEEVIYKAP